MKTTFNPFTGKLDYLGTSIGTAGLLSDYTVSNVTSTFLYDASNTSLDEIASVLGTLIASIKVAPSPFSLSGFVVLNVTTNRTYDANNTSLDELANVLGSLITTLQSGSLDVYTVTNAIFDHIYDATNTSFDEIADVLG